MSASEPKLFYIGVKALIKRDGKILVLKRAKKDEIYWDLPGGRINNNETQIEALKRELVEEIPSIQEIEIKKIVSSCNFNKDLIGGGLFFLFYDVSANTVQVLLGNEHSQHKWIDQKDLDSIKKDMFSGYYDAIKASLLK
ncbi:NUDIX hydrolase [Candidatus Parcubacteria bacterium]|nr:NUDIX hydrolase [Candidatus Parcubacteria bacterium]